MYNLLKKKCSCFSLCCYYDHFSDRLKELFQLKNGLTTSLLGFFFLENAKNLGRSDDAKRRKKEDGLNLLHLQKFFQANRLL